MNALLSSTGSFQDDRFSELRGKKLINRILTEFPTLHLIPASRDEDVCPQAHTRIFAELSWKENFGEQGVCRISSILFKFLHKIFLYNFTGNSSECIITI